MMMATRSSAPRMYLLDANQDSDCSAELKNGAELSVARTSEGTSVEDDVEVGDATGASASADSVDGDIESCAGLIAEAGAETVSGAACGSVIAGSAILGSAVLGEF